MSGGVQENAFILGHDSIITLCLTSCPLCPSCNYFSKTKKNQHETITASSLSGCFSDGL